MQIRDILGTYPLPGVCRWMGAGEIHRMYGPDGRQEGGVYRVGGQWQPVFMTRHLPLELDLVRAKIMVARARAQARGGIIEWDH